METHKIRLLFLIRALTIGGAQRQVINLANGLAEHGFAVTVAVFYPGGELANNLNPAVQLIALEKEGRWSFIGFYLRLISLIRQYKPDILYSFLTTSNVLSATLKLFFPRLIVIWGKRSAVREVDWSRWLDRSVIAIERRLARTANLIIYNSKELQRVSIQMGFPKERTCIIPNGFDTKIFFPDTNARAQNRAMWAIQPHEQLIGIVGRLDPVKDHANFLHAASLIASANRNARFAVIGDGDPEYKHQLQQLCEQLQLSERTIWPGFQVNMCAVYNTFDLLISSSLAEAFPNVLGEAMACGLPCVATDVGDSAWIIGENGKIVAPKAPDAIAQAANELLNGASSFDPAAARSHIVQQFSLEALIKRTADILRQLSITTQ